MLVSRLLKESLGVMQTINCTREVRFGGGRFLSLGVEGGDLAYLDESCGDRGVEILAVPKLML